MVDFFPLSRPDIFAGGLSFDEVDAAYDWVNRDGAPRE